MGLETFYELFTNSASFLKANGLNTSYHDQSLTNKYKVNYGPGKYLPPSV